MAPRGAAQKGTVKSKYLKKVHANPKSVDKKKQEVKPPRPTSPKKPVKKPIYSPNVSSSELSDFTADEEEPRVVHYAKLKKDEDEKKKGGDPPASTSTTSLKTPRQLRAERRAAEIRGEDFTDDEKSGKKAKVEDKKPVAKKPRGRKRKQPAPDAETKGGDAKEKTAAGTEPENQDPANKKASSSNAKGTDLLGQRPKRLKQKQQDPSADAEGEYVKDEQAPDAKVEIPLPLTDAAQVVAVSTGKAGESASDSDSDSDGDSNISISSETKALFRHLIPPVRSYSPAPTSSSSSAASEAAVEDSSPSPKPFILPIPLKNPFNLSTGKESSSSSSSPPPQVGKDPFASLSDADPSSSSSSSSSSPSPENVALPAQELKNPFAVYTSTKQKLKGSIFNNKRPVPVAEWPAELAGFARQEHLARQITSKKPVEAGPRKNILSNERPIPVADLAGFAKQLRLAMQNMPDNLARVGQNLTSETPASSPVPLEEHDDSKDDSDSEMIDEEEKSPWLVNPHSKVLDDFLSGHLRKIAQTLNFMIRAKASGINVDDTDALAAVTPEQWDQLAEVPDDAADIMVQNLLSLPASDMSILAERASILRDDLLELGITIT
ncbi:hypothetical protein GQX73_g2947 [Xylaria multiplex]|uniref:Uncharacterized protein n=1 Tax=Xylaria multiplex TaxID=323545 RepID=A0A7C8IRQ1_9PEZI|nr:hypothetical protein GQX73_g2947 [Xylaria multiplex]